MECNLCHIYGRKKTSKSQWRFGVPKETAFIADFIMMCSESHLKRQTDKTKDMSEADGQGAVVTSGRSTPDKFVAGMKMGQG